MSINLTSVNISFNIADMIRNTKNQEAKKETDMTWTEEQLNERRDFCGRTMTLKEWLAIPEDERAEIVSEYGKDQRKAQADAKKAARRQAAEQGAPQSSKPVRRHRGIDGIRLGDGSEDDCLGY